MLSVSHCLRSARLLHFYEGKNSYPTLNVRSSEYSFHAFLSHYLIQENVPWQLFQWGHLAGTAARGGHRSFFSTEENKRNRGRYREKLNFCLSGTLSAVDGVAGPEE